MAKNGKYSKHIKIGSVVIFLGSLAAAMPILNALGFTFPPWATPEKVQNLEAEIEFVAQRGKKTRRDYLNSEIERRKLQGYQNLREQRGYPAGKVPDVLLREKSTIEGKIGEYREELEELKERRR